jgi:hypothetical protein
MRQLLLSGDNLIRRASMSRCQSYRYSLVREWTRSRKLVIIGLNPSTADHQIDDPTVRRCIRFAESWGFGKLVLVNLFAYRATDPTHLTSVDDPIGPRNDQSIRRAVGSADLVLVAWGNKGSLLNRHWEILSWLPRPYCLGTTKQGFPRHPLYLRRDVIPVPFNMKSPRKRGC